MSDAHHRRGAVAVVYTAALFMVTIDVTIVNVALPTIGRDLGTASAALGSVSTAYLVAIAVVVSAAAWLHARLGGRTALLAAIGLFTIASGACGAAPSFEVLIVSRAVQGVGGGLLAPVGLGMLYEVYPPADRVRVTASTSLVTGFAPILGPTAGGLLVGSISWRAVFLVNVPLGAVTVLIGFAALRQAAAPDRSERFDVAGFLLAASGLPMLVLGLSTGADQRWRSPLPAASAAAGLLLIGLFTARTLRRREAPLLRLQLLRGRPFALGLIIVLLSNAAFFGALYVIALHLQRGLRLPPAVAGVAMLLETVPVLAGAQLTSRVLLRRFRASAISAVGLGALSVCLLLMAIAPDELGAFLPLLVLLGTAWSMVFIPVTIGANEQIVGDDTAHAATLLSTVRQVASALGIALAASAVAVAHDDRAGFAAVALPATAAAAVVLVGRARRG